MFFLYEVLLHLVFVVTLPFFLLIGILRGKYLVNFPERLGFYRTRPAAHDLWIHAVSVGEALAAQKVIDLILQKRPRTSIVFTTTTITGQAQARRLYPGATVTYFPFDFTFSVWRFLQHFQPRVYATMETELWPNVTRLSRRRGMRLLLANGRISDRSFPRYRAFRFLVRPIVRMYEKILVRDATDRERFIAIGAPPEIVETTGNVKFDFEPDSAPLEIVRELEQLVAGRPVLVLGSTQEGEDEDLIPEIERLARQVPLFTIVAPRRPERFEVVAGLLTTSALSFVRRSEIRAGEAAGAPPRDVLLLDSVGELRRIYRYAALAFVGGSLVPHGGQNPIEPAASGVPVCFGPHMSNFREIAASFLNAEGAAEVQSAAEVAAFARRMIEDEALRRAWGERARRTVMENRGASERTAQRIVALLA